MTFVDFQLSSPILRAVEAQGYTTPTPVQAQTIPHTLEGRDVLGCAQTGTGKTAAFALPMLHRLAQQPRPRPQAHSPGKPAKAAKPIRALVLCPTRELASQIHESFETYGKNLPLRHAVIFGGVNQNPQVQALRRGVDVLVATPGRLIDLMTQRHVDLRAVEILVLDEADRMLDMGFIHDIHRIVEHVPDARQTLLFSATMPTEIRRLADKLLRDPVTIQIAPQSPAAERIDQSVYFVPRAHKTELLAHLIERHGIARGIVFTRTKHGADRVVKQLRQRGVSADAIHGDKTQGARQRALDRFREGRVPVLVATDIASRGLDIDDVTHVINYDVSREPESYVHRIGRTARAGASGMAISFCDQDELPLLRAIERLIRRDIAVCDDHPPHLSARIAIPAAMPKRAVSHPLHKSQAPRRGGNSYGNGPRKQRRRRPAAAR